MNEQYAFMSNANGEWERNVIGHEYQMQLKPYCVCVWLVMRTPRIGGSANRRVHRIGGNWLTWSPCIRLWSMPRIPDFYKRPQFTERHKYRTRNILCLFAAAIHANVNVSHPSCRQTPIEWWQKCIDNSLKKNHDKRRFCHGHHDRHLHSHIPCCKRHKQFVECIIYITEANTCARCVYMMSLSSRSCNILSIHGTLLNLQKLLRCELTCPDEALVCK